MTDNKSYPHFIPTKPSGKDCFEGKSQKHLAESISDYIKKTDQINVSTIPRIIGLEGSWGSGKSNVIEILKEELPTGKDEDYYLYCYDAWGHQEDLQRRSILENMTQTLIKDGILEGEGSIRLRNGQIKKDKWENLLSYLLSNKTTTTVSHHSQASSFVLVMIGIIIGVNIISYIIQNFVEIFDRNWAWWIVYFIPYVLGVIYIISRFCNDKNWNFLGEWITKTKNDDVTEQYTSSEEPSVTEFKNWMEAISTFIGKGKTKKKDISVRKLIIVFDNMDRLPSEKVMQLWSSIYTFFAGGEYDNIWAIIPYDYMHLCQAINGEPFKLNVDENGKINDDGNDKIKRFISKTFPITYYVAPPVVSDYELLFKKYFEEAFGQNEHDEEHIYQVYRSLEPIPNPREVISFVNALVSLKLQWPNNDIRLQNMALFILKQDYILYLKDGSAAALLSEDLFKGISPLYPEKEEVRTQLSQLTFELKDKNLAQEIPLRKVIQENLNQGKSMDEYTNRPMFIKILEVEMNNVNDATMDNAVLSLAATKEDGLNDDDKDKLHYKWDFLTNKKAEGIFVNIDFDKTLSILITHSSSRRRYTLIGSYCNAIQQPNIKKDESYYRNLSALEKLMRDIDPNFKIGEYLSSVSTDVDDYISFLKAAGKNYDHYKLTTKSDGLSKYLYENVTKGSDGASLVISYLKDDKTYNFDSLLDKIHEFTNSSEKLPENILPLAYANRVLEKGNGKLHNCINKTENTSYIKNYFKKDSYKASLLGLADVVAMYLAGGDDIDDLQKIDILEPLSDCIDYYMDYTDVLRHLGTEGSAFRLLNVYMIQNKKGQSLDSKYVAANIINIHDQLSIDWKLLFEQFNRWKSIDWGDFNVNNQYVKDVSKYVLLTIFDKYKENPCKFTESIIQLGVKAIEFEPKGFLVPIGNYIIDDYWKQFILCYLGSKYMLKASPHLTEELKTALNGILNNQSHLYKDEVVERLEKYADGATLSAYLYEIMNTTLKSGDMSENAFLHLGILLPQVTSDMDTNTASMLISHFIKPVALIPSCATIIVEHRDFYQAILNKELILAAPIMKEMVKMKEYEPMKDYLEKQIEINNEGA